MGYDFTTVVDRSGTGSAKWEAMKRADPNVPEGIVPFSVADMELKNPPEVTEGLKRYLDDAVLGYTIPSESYLSAVCGWMESHHRWRIRPEWIVPTPGVVTAFYHAVRAFTKPGDGVIILTPVYYPFYSAIETNGRRIVPSPLRDVHRHYEIDFDDLKKKAEDPANTMLLFCSPHNPVGRVWTKEELEKIADLCLSNHVLVVSDEIHFDLILPGHEHTVFAALSEEAADRCVVCTAPSKTFNLAGMQASNIVIRNPGLRRRFREELKASGLGGLSILGYRACEIAYTQCARWLEELLALIDRNRKMTENFMAERIPEISVYPLEGTYLQWWDCRALGMSAGELERFMVRRASLFFDEGGIFGPAGKGFERINLACPSAVLQRALERLSSALKEK